MKNRIPKYPGRVKLSPVPGQANVFDIVRLDEAVEEGTPLNKETLLSDATAKLFGKTVGAVPNDIFTEIYNRLSNLSYYLNNKVEIRTGSFTPNGTVRSISLGINAKFVVAYGYLCYLNYSDLTAFYFVTEQGCVGDVASGSNSHSIGLYTKIKYNNQLNASLSYIEGSQLMLQTYGLNAWYSNATNVGTVHWIAFA